MHQLKFMAISGSLRKLSYNSAVLKAIKELSSPEVEINIYKGLSNIPLFNPDLEIGLISEVIKMKNNLANSHGLIIASPEYAHGITGALKNALDWLVEGEEFVNIPVMLINTSPRASHAIESLKEVIRTMSGNIVESSCVSIQLLGGNLDHIGILENQKLSSQLKHGLNEFSSNIRNET